MDYNFNIAGLRYSNALQKKMEKIILLETAAGTIAIVAFLIAYTRRIKKKLRSHVLRNKEVNKYLKER